MYFSPYPFCVILKAIWAPWIHPWLSLVSAFLELALESDGTTATEKRLRMYRRYSNSCAYMMDLMRRHRALYYRLLLLLFDERARASLQNIQFSLIVGSRIRAQILVMDRHGTRPCWSPNRSECMQVQYHPDCALRERPELRRVLFLLYWQLTPANTQATKSPRLPAGRCICRHLHKGPARSSHVCERWDIVFQSSSCYQSIQLQNSASGRNPVPAPFLRVRRRNARLSACLWWALEQWIFLR